MKPLYLLAWTIFLISGCDMPQDPGPMPSEIVATEFEPGLNILGVLRADNQQGSSFINVNRALTTEEIYSDSIINFSPALDFVRVSASSTGTDYVFLPAGDSSNVENYQDTSLTVQVGEAYSLEISAPDFPVLSAYTQVPEQPQLVANTLSVAAGSISFQLQHQTSAFEYKLYLIFPDGALKKLIKPTDQDIIAVDWDYEVTKGDPRSLMLCALDENLTRYENSPISFLPNTYHPDGSTVTGGYGCFGSVSITTYEL
ncbi:MAG: DUF4249 domain-containing protein [Candidatus Marinimicrobia bacterium]|nr:DUF4249 domain-containing protein [Candidatus Neomarinimicrobiota bacterium]